MKVELNKSLGIVLDDLKNNHGFGSNFQFWVTKLTDEINERTNLSEKQSHNLALNCILRIYGNYNSNYVKEETNE